MRSRALEPPLIPPLVPPRLAAGLWLDVLIYGLSALFAWYTWVGSTLAAHRAWGSVALYTYLVATLLAAIQVFLAARASPARAWRLAGQTGRIGLAAATFLGVTVLPLLIQVVQRAGGRLDRAQEEVPVIEDGGRRLLEFGTPYLTRDAIAALPEPLLGYLPYQPGMAIFGVPRALDGTQAWWSDARVWFALVAVAAVVGTFVLLRALPVRALQVVAVLPLTALTMVTSGNDPAVLGLCVLAFALAATGRFGAAGLVVGAAAALKLFAWPIAVVLAVHAFTHRQPTGPGPTDSGTAGTRSGRVLRFVTGAVALPVLTAIPALAINTDALVENVVRFPFGHGLMSSPAASPLPGYLIANHLPHGRTIATALLVLAGLAIAGWLVRRPPRTVADAAALSGYGLLAAMLLMVSSRFGYLLYPVTLLVWSRALRPPRLASEETDPDARLGAPA